MAKLHEGLALLADRQGIAKKIVDEARSTFKSGAHFQGWTQTTEYLNTEDAFQNKNEEKIVDDTVPSKLAYVSSKIIPAIDLIYQIDIAGREAVADLVIDGKVLAKDVPVNTLIKLEQYMKELRAMYDMIPTHQPGINWQPDLDKSKAGTIFCASLPEITFLTKKISVYPVVVAATEHHPAQVKESHEDKKVAKVTKLKYTGTISPAEKSDMLGRIDQIIQAAKRARSRANTVELKRQKIGKALLDFINKGTDNFEVSSAEDSEEI